MSNLNINCVLPRSHFDLTIDNTLNINGITAIFGPSGSGKSSLLQVLAGLIKPAQANITFEQETWQDPTTFIVAEKRGVGLVFQDNRLFPHLTVLQNLAYAQKRSKSKRHNIHDIAKLANINTLFSQYPKQLSGGEQQRVAIVRAIINDPKLLLLDEPFSALDIAHKAKLLTLLRTLQQHFKLPMIYVSHSLDDIQQLADHLLVLKQGKVTHYGNVHQVIHQLNYGEMIHQQTSLSLPVTSFNDSFELLSLALTNKVNILLNKPLHYVEQQQLHCFINASEISVCLTQPTSSSIVNTLAGTITNIQKNNGQALISVTCYQQEFFALISTYSLEKLALTPNQHVFIQFKASSVKTLNQ